MRRSCGLTRACLYFCTQVDTGGCRVVENSVHSFVIYLFICEQLFTFIHGISRLSEYLLWGMGSRVIIILENIVTYFQSIE